MEKFLDVHLSPAVIASVIVGVLTVAVYAVVKHLKERHSKKHSTSGAKLTAIRMGFSAAQLLVIVLGVVVILQINGVNITVLAAGIGIVGAVVGLALQDYLRDVIMGIHILIDHFFSVGECVEWDGREGMILELTLMSTKIGDLDDHSVITVCNRDISKVRRLGKRLDIDIPLSYKEDVSAVHSVMKTISERIALLSGVSECEYKGTQSFESSAIIYRLRVFCDPKERADVRRAAISTVQSSLNEAGIQIPFNQLDVHCDMVNQNL